MALKTKLYDSFFRRSFSVPLSIQYWDGTQSHFGDGNPQYNLILHTPLNWKAVVSDPFIALTEAYMKKDIEIEGNLQKFIVSAFQAPMGFTKDAPLFSLGKSQKHNKSKAVKDIQLHYDIGNEFYKKWLDSSMTYSCAYFKEESNTLEAAQKQKREHILKKLRLKSGDRLLDIGCGWGQLILHAAQKYSIYAVGCTLSQQQYDFVKQSINHFHLQDRVSVLLMDYRDLPKTGQLFDKIVSVGMFEHVGKKDIPLYFQTINKLMAPRSLALIHGISGQRNPDDTAKGYNGFLNKYIFPGGYIPSVSEIVTAIGKEALQLIDLESLRRHYQLTLESWTSQFHRHWGTLLKEKGEQFMRMWDIYLQGCAAIFEAGGIDVCQYLIEKGIDNTRPLQRTYMA